MDSGAGENGTVGGNRAYAGIVKIEANLPRVVATKVGTSRTRFTGPPTGLDPRLVPQCQLCAQPMSFIGQYGDVEHPLLDGGDVVYGFICLEDSCALDAGVPGHAVAPAHRVVVAQFDPVFATDGPDIEWQPIYEEYPAHLSDFLFEVTGPASAELELLRVASLVHGAANGVECLLGCTRPTSASPGQVYATSRSGRMS